MHPRVRCCGVRRPSSTRCPTATARASTRSASNALRASRTGEVAVGASQTLASPAEAEWKYVSVRRTFIFLEHSIDKGTQWAVFEPNAEPLWAELRCSIGAFLEPLWRAGAFQGANADEAYFVRCDQTTMTQADIDAGTVNVVVGFAPLQPAEFVVLRIGLKAARDDPDP
jgi:phage tail sheath protein FI